MVKATRARTSRGAAPASSRVRTALCAGIRSPKRNALLAAVALACLLPVVGAAQTPAEYPPVPRYYTHPNYANSPFPAVAPGSCSGAPAISCTSYLQCPTGQTCNGASAAGGLRKFVDGLPLLGPGGANGLVTPGGDPAGQYIPVATADETTYPGSDYYVIVLGEYSEKLHSDLPATKLRGYRQANMGGTPFHYLGPAIVATKDRPVRILFRNALPTGAGGNLFIPVDTTVMGSGMGPGMFDPATGAMMEEMDPQRPMCGQTFDPVAKVQLPKPAGCYTENRATLHLHGGISPWISDGTPHQWITPAGEDTPYKKGVSVSHVPDMWFDAAGQTIASCAGQTTCTEPNATNDPGPGAMTFYYTNQQSARLMFYHDHAWGITRLNVYAGEAAPYVITDDTEKALVASGAIPGALDTIPLVVQDKTFVPDAAQLAAQDETWDVDRWGGPGSLWLPHVYSPAQNPGELTGVNGYGRWAYGPWFWPATVDIEHGPMDNPHIDPTCIPGVTALYCEPPTMPGVPYVSMGMESFHDTPLVNGTAYPTITLAPKAYRFRILNAANDRFFNLSLYKAVDARGVLCDANNPAPVAESTGETCTEVALNPAEVIAALADPAGVFPTPLASSAGPSWIQFATEGGFLPSPVEIPPQPITWVTDPTVFNAGNVDQHSLLLGPAERADVVVDLSAYAGQTLILYNDAPAAFPARDPRYDYYTANADLTESGGAPTTIPGYGPNTRTVMRIVVQGTPGPAFDLAKLEAAFAHNAEGTGVFESGQHPIIVGQSGYNAAYGKTFTDAEGFVQIFQTAITFNTLGGQQLTIPLRPKMIQDEMGEAFEHEYGRMSGFMGVETPNAQAGLQNMILYAYAHPPTEIIDAVEIPGTGGLQVSPISTSDDGTQIWKITHNGVDTHPVHFHLYEVQLLNRVGWDGIVRPPDANELGWKDTVRVSPLEDTIVALRPVLPHVPFDLPNSIRLLDPSMPDGAWIANTTAQEAAGLPLFAFNPDGEPIDIRNHYVNYGWEYVWHCHILSHEEMDMMRPQVVGVAPKAPGVPTWVVVGSGGNRANRLTWTDNSKNETAFVIERRALGSTGPWTVRATIPSDRLNVGPGTGARTYDDRIGTTKTTFEYQVTAINTVGDAFNYADPAFNEITVGGFPTLTLDSRGNATSSLAAPTLSVPAAFRKSGKIAGVTLQWSDPNAHERGFIIQRADNAGFSLGVVNATVGADVTTLTQNVSRGKTYYYRVQAFSETMSSAWSNVRSVTTP